MSKKIVICCDGAGNEYGEGERESNVQKLYSVLPKNNKQRVKFYDPGVGMFSLPAALTKTARLTTKILGMAFGLGITENITNAYRYLMETYERGDKVYLFGFSRGAYAVRALAAMMFKCGLLYPRTDNLVPCAVKLLMHYHEEHKKYSDFRRKFSRRCHVHFLGVWDTVKSVGWIYDPLTLQFTMNNPIVRVVRHAVSIDERRCFFRQNLWGQRCRDVKQVWFAGSHSDVGGSYPEEQSGLSQIALQWMIEEAKCHGLVVNSKEHKEVVPQKDGGDKAKPDYTAELHRSLRRLWWLAEFIPQRRYVESKVFQKEWTIPLGRPRRIPEESLIHESVLRRMESDHVSYHPRNLPAKYRVEPGH